MMGLFLVFGTEVIGLHELLGSDSKCSGIHLGFGLNWYRNEKSSHGFGPWGKTYIFNLLAIQLYEGMIIMNLHAW